MGFRKVMWSGPGGQTGGLVFSENDLAALREGDFVGNLSRHWPFAECTKMKSLHISEEYATWDEAFAHEFGQ